MKKSVVKELVEIVEDAMSFCEFFEMATKDGKQDIAFPKIRGFIDERLNDCIEWLDDERDALQDKYYDLSEKSQDGAKGQDIQNEISDIDSVISSLQDCMAAPLRDEAYMKDAIRIIQSL